MLQMRTGGFWIRTHNGKGVNIKKTDSDDLTREEIEIRLYTLREDVPREKGR